MMVRGGAVGKSEHIIRIMGFTFRTDLPLLMWERKGKAGQREMLWAGERSPNGLWSVVLTLP